MLIQHNPDPNHGWMMVFSLHITMETVLFFCPEHYIVRICRSTVRIQIWLWFLSCVCGSELGGQSVLVLVFIFLLRSETHKPGPRILVVLSDLARWISPDLCSLWARERMTYALIGWGSGFSLWLFGSKTHHNPTYDPPLCVTPTPYEQPYISPHGQPTLLYSTNQPSPFPKISAEIIPRETVSY